MFSVVPLLRARLSSVSGMVYMSFPLLFSHLHLYRPLMLDSLGTVVLRRVS